MRRPEAMRAGLLVAALALSPSLASAQYSAQDNAVDDRVRASAMAAESYQGPLDGSWTLVGGDGKPIYAFQLVDKAGGRDPLEGVWRDLRHPILPGDIHLIDQLDRGGDALTITLNATPTSPQVVITLHQGADRAWSGSLRETAGQATPVTLRRAG